jgi:hypothetical protein
MEVTNVRVEPIVTKGVIRLSHLSGGLLARVEGSDIDGRRRTGNPFPAWPKFTGRSSIRWCGLGPSLYFGSVTRDRVQKLSDLAINRVRAFHISAQKTFCIGLGRAFIKDSVEL